MRSLKYAHSFEVVRNLPPQLLPLRELAYNFRWTWDHDTQALFREVDRELWEELEHNPVELINRLAPQRQQHLVEDEVFLAKLDVCRKNLEEYIEATTWFDRTFPAERENCRVAYFCAEFGLNECLPIYSGGLGVLAGDHLKAASDLGIPLVGVGLLYSRGYFRQFLTPDGWQQEHYPRYDFYRMPLELVRGDDGQPIRVGVDFPDVTVTVQIWKAKVGRIELYLLDSNILENRPDVQNITDTLYGGDEDMRIRQEIVLGIGGFKALTRLGLTPSVCHMNEGHAAFLSIERIRHFIEQHNCDFKTARQCVVAGNVFTTHTPVPAGFDLFSRPLLERYMTSAVNALNLPFEKFLDMGRIEPTNKDEPFNMAVLAMENANYVNGVSKLHAEVSRGMFQRRWPDYPEDEVPIEAVTNGVHTMSWMSSRMANLLDRQVGPTWREDPSDPELWKAVDNISDQDLWEMRENARGDFVRYCRRHLRRAAERSNTSPMDANVSQQVLDPRILTIGFARRFATYKRATLLFADMDRLRRLLNHPDRPVQLVFAGKSHPRDDGGKKLIQDIIGFVKSEGPRSRIVFLEDYDMNVARHMIKGVDLWLNNPRRPMEASGTSGMKVIPNGGLNCSILDGWWAEGYEPGAGWAIGQGRENPDAGYQDWLDSQSLYHILENEIVPTFYHRTEGGIPRRWIEMMRESMKQMAPVFSTSRMVREYTSRFYVPASRAFNRLAADNQALAKTALEWRQRVRDAWPNVKITSVEDTAARSNNVGDAFVVTARVDLGALNPAEVEVQALSGHVGMNRELDGLLLHDLDLVESHGSVHTFRGTVNCDVPGFRGYTVRVVPHHTDVRVPTELPLVCWESS